jgi:hypothetical protein
MPLYQPVMLRKDGQYLLRFPLPRREGMKGRGFPRLNDASVHLCQPDTGKSCGACCGLYNYADSARASLVRRLRERTARFHATVHGIDDLPAFSEQARRAEDQAKRYEVIYCCEYAGFLDPQEKRVGCLLHPSVHGGADLRSVSFYGRELCDGHFCPSYHYLSGDEKRSLIYILEDWYLYGLCVTDIDLVKEYFRLISDGICETPAPETFRNGPLRDSARRFFDLKLTWPFRSPAVNRLGKYYFDGSQYMIKPIDYPKLGCERSRFDRIFSSLSSEFTSRRDVAAAERLIQVCIDEFIGNWQRVLVSTPDIISPTGRRMILCNR